MQTAFITGIGGFGGSHLAELLLSRGWQISGTVNIRASRSNLENLRGSAQFFACEMRDTNFLHELIAEKKPDAIFHLAAKTTDHETRKDPAMAFDVNAVGTVRLLDAVRAANLDNTRIVLAGSSAEYGRVENDDPIDETHALNPVGMYGVTKIAQSMVGLQYHLAYGMNIIRTRAFNHTGPRQAANFSTAAFARQIAEIEAAKHEPVLQVGDLSQRRDLSDVRDVVRGYLLAMEHGISGEVYNIAAGSAVRTQEVLDRLLAMSKVKIAVATDPGRLRPAEVAVQIGDTKKLRDATGWKPEIGLEKTLADTLDYWRGHLR